MENNIILYHVTIVSKDFNHVIPCPGNLTNTDMQLLEGASVWTQSKICHVRPALAHGMCYTRYGRRF